MGGAERGGESDRVRRSRAAGTPSASAADDKCCRRSSASLGIPKIQSVFFFLFFFCFPSPERFQHRGPRPNYVLLRGIAGANAVTQGILTEGLICSDVFAGSGSAPVDSADGEQQTRSRRAAPGGAKTKGPFFLCDGRK